MKINKKHCENLALNGGSMDIRKMAPGFEGGLVGNCENGTEAKRQNQNNAGTSRSSQKSGAQNGVPPDIQ